MTQKPGHGGLISSRLSLLLPGLIFEVTFKAIVQMNAFWSLWRDEADFQPLGWQLPALRLGPSPGPPFTFQETLLVLDPGSSSLPDSDSVWGNGLHSRIQPK